MRSKVGDFILVEGYCFATTDKYPCSQDGVSMYCMLNGGCPYFSYEDGDIRSALLEVPLWRTILDRAVYYGKEYWWRIGYAFGFGQKDSKLVKELLDNVEINLSENTPEIISDQQNKFNEFKQWQEEVESEEKGEDDANLSRLW